MKPGQVPGCMPSLCPEAMPPPHRTPPQTRPIPARPARPEARGPPPARLPGKPGLFTSGLSRKDSGGWSGAAR